jgi:hypothetical protein
VVIVAALFLPAVAVGLLVRVLVPRLFPRHPGVQVWVERYWPWVPLVVVAGILAVVAWQAALVSIVAFAAGWRYRHRIVLMQPTSQPRPPSTER